MTTTSSPSWVIDESIEDDHVGIDQWTEILEILAMQVGRLTLERYNTSDKYAYNMNEEAKAHNKKWGEITDQEDKDGEDQKRQRWLHSTWHHFKCLVGESEYETSERV
ncbi:hypothetical protein N7509_005076 [Penicillium cosmopolitanum]|uniref:Uncharacterized protein n=1 Tax=Penicillium cosmopolitanum TaxID=1131564 RepID=A0A9X0B9P7_9EURO|nr:uncharacterized protein N7509_005076 [Penicillium cosmopolitanum]KAJ5396963.1 hypothetical protein N7509_005076 [Penicillium cosmopolitanum]